MIMSVNQSSRPALRERAMSELKELFYITAYLFVVFGALSFYKSAILEAEGVHWLPWGFALIKAVILAKFIMIGRALYGGGGHRTKPLIWQIVNKSVAFLILVAGFFLKVLAASSAYLRYCSLFAVGTATTNPST